MDGRRCAGDDGGGLIEYGLLVALIAAVCLAAVSFVGRATGDTIRTSCEQITTDVCE
jgi:Flp pilus assembly pilin Flp